MNFEFAIIKSDNCTYLCRKDEETYYCVDNPMLSFTEGEDEFEIIPPDMSYRKKIYKYKGRKVRVEPAIYENGWLAISVVNTRNSDDYEYLTTNLGDPDAFGLPAHTFVDCNNHPDALRFLEENGLAKNANYQRQSGFVNYPMVIADLALLYQHNPEVFQFINP